MLLLIVDELGQRKPLHVAALLRLQGASVLAPVRTPLRFVVAALAVSAGVGLLSGLLPARRAAAVEPMQALRRE